MHYYLYKQDIQRLKTFGAPYFSPSISWSRIFPFGKGPVNKQGIKHYDDVIAELVKQGIKPAISLFHWDTPLALFNEYGGWTNPRIVDDYLNYAKFIISRYDKYVPVWFSINEPQYCNWQYSTYPAGYWPSYGHGPGVRTRFLCGHYTLLAHAKLAKWYHEEFKGKGRISFKNSANYFEPATNSTKDLEAVKRTYDFTLGWFGGVWTDGDYPQSLKDTLGDVLPKFTEAEKKLIKGSCDFFALDGYTSLYVSTLPEGQDTCTGNSSYPGFPECTVQSQVAPDGFGIGPGADLGASWLKSTPIGIRKFLKQVTTELFPAVKDIIVSEIGFAEPFESSFTNIQDATWDLRRADYIQGFMDNILLSITEDKVNVTGAFIWSIFDNFEWFSGIKTRFGLQHLDYDTLERVPKASWFQAQDWFKRHGAKFVDGTESD